jgi:hypothetical protein
MKDITTSIYTFDSIIQGNFLYVDKTEYVWQLIRPVKEMYFLSRPRRFGKSLLISTLEAIFKGKKELFQGLALYSKPYDWQKHPVIHLDFVNCDSRTPEELREYLEHLLQVSADELKLKLRGTGPSMRFENLMNDAATSSEAHDVVVLVDEYDKPILGNIDDLPRCRELLPVLKGFYSNIKKCEKNIRLAFVTGVSKFSHVSLFSDLNNLTDITLSPAFAELLGFTEQEIRTNFADRLPLAAKATGLAKEELMRQLLDWYDGYRFSEADTHVCNPVSLSSFFSNSYKFSNYWDSTGTPSFLLKLMRDQAYDHEAALDKWYSEGVFSSYELEKFDITGLLWQTGYLTIKDIAPGLRGTKFRLDFPDFEVADTFMQRLLEFYCQIPKGTGDDFIEDFQQAIVADDLDRFMSLLQTFFASIPYDIQLPREKYFQTVFFVIFRLLGTAIEAESHTNIGSIDAYVRTAKTIYIFEFKLNQNARKAIAQIIDRHYYEKYQNCGLPIRLVGVNFDLAKGRLVTWKEHKKP